MTALDWSKVPSGTFTGATPEELTVAKIYYGRGYQDGVLQARKSARQATAKLAWLLVFLGCVIAAIALLTAPKAAAWPTCTGGYEMGTPWGGYCDGVPEATGQHWHCQWGFGFSLCEWRWPDNTVAPNPYT